MKPLHEAVPGTKHPGDMTDEEIHAAILECARLINECDSWAWCVYVTRMAQLLGELHGKPPEHGDFVASFAAAKNRLP